MTYFTHPAEERFWSKVARDPETDCWEWLGAKCDGYGSFWLGEPRSRGRAHRWAHEHLVGPIPEGLVIDHLCRNRGCVNPAHLEPVTDRENILRGAANPAAKNAAKTHCNRGHEFTPENTARFPSGGQRRRCRACLANRNRA